MPVLLAQLTKQEEDQDKDQGIWNLSMAAGTCLSLFAACVGDPVIGLVLPYVQVPPACCWVQQQNGSQGLPPGFRCCLPG